MRLWLLWAAGRNDYAPGQKLVVLPYPKLPHFAALGLVIVEDQTELVRRHFNLHRLLSIMEAFLTHDPRAP